MSIAHTQKLEKVDSLVADLKSAKSAALVQYQGLTAGDIGKLRAQIKDKGGRLEVIKNSIISRALLKMGFTLPTPLTGPTAVTYCTTDETAPLKEIEEINKAKEKTSFKYGIYNQALLSADDLKKFLNLPSKSALFSQLLGGLTNPLQRLTYSLRYNQTRLVLALKAVTDKKN